MTYTAEQLREWAANSEASIRALGLKETDFKIANYLADVLRAHADALEENARLKEELTLTRMWIDAAVASCAKRGCTKKEYEATKEQRDRAERAEAELAKLRAEANDDDALRERMADILTRTAAALKGEPEPLTLHDWSGLPEIAELALTAERERADRNQEDAERYQWLRMNRLWLKANLPMIHAGAFDAAIDAARRK